MEDLRRFINRKIEEIKNDSPAGAVFTVLCWLLVIVILVSLLWQAVSLLFHPQVIAEQMAGDAHDGDFLSRSIGNIAGIAVLAVMLWLARR